MKKLLLLPFALFTWVFGQVSWQSPPWLNWAKTHKLQALLVVLLLFCAGSAGWYFNTQPKPLALQAKITAPKPAYQDAKPDSLKVVFYNPENSQMPAARIDLIDSAISQGVSISPAIKGKWRFQGANTLVFKPEQHWPAGSKYQVQLNNTIFAKGSHLASNKLVFTTPKLTLALKNYRFYQDPQDSQIKKVVATVNASHPLDKTSFENAIRLTMAKANAQQQPEKQRYAFTVSYDKYQQQAFIHSELIRLPEQSNTMQLSITPGVKSLLGGKASEQAVEGKVVIPDIYSFLKVAEFDNHIVNDKQGTPWQTISLSFTDAINKQQLQQHLKLWQLPKKGQSEGRRSWRSVAQVTDAVLAQSQPVSYQVLDTPRPNSRSFHLQYQGDENAYLYLTLNKGLQSSNQFILAENFNSVSPIPNYPKTVNIAGEGALLAYSGEHKLSVVSRGVPAIKYSIAKVRKDQLYHLVSQTEGDLQDARFQSWQFNEQQVSEIHTEIQTLKNASGKTLSYSSLDLSPYISRQASDAGLFIIEAMGYNPKNKRSYRQAKDKRLILVSDLGLLVKNNRNNSHEVFVQSIATGMPVANAKVELLGKNGLPIITRSTNATGHAHIPPTQGFTKEKQPVVYLVQKGSDVSFIPFNRYSTQINLSRFDIGGVHPRQNHNKASKAYMFTDRGIYRPGETAHIAAVVKTEGLANIENMPVQWVVENPRGQQVLQKTLLVPSKGLMDISFSPDKTAPTGRYYARLHLLHDNQKRRGQMLGSVNFTVEEFEPDTLKITSRLKGVGDSAWFTGKSLEAEVQLANLFGSPAQNRRLQGELSIHPSAFYFKEYADYQFDQAQLGDKQKPLSIREKLAAQTTDPSGKGAFTIDLSRFQYGTYRLRFSVQGFAKDSGRSVAANNSALIYPLNYLLGYKADAPLGFIAKGSKRQLHWQMINNKLKPQAFENLSLKTLAINTVSSLVKQADGTYLYEDSQQEQLLKTQTLSLSASGKQWPLATDKVGDFVLEAYDKHGNRLARVPYTVVGEANVVANIEKQSPLQLKLKGNDFSPGDDLQLQIQAPFKGTGLITIESDSVHAYKWFRADKQSTLLNMPVPEGLQGNAYVNVAFVRDSQSPDIFSQPLSYAVQPFTVNRKQHQTPLQLSVPKQVKPGDNLTIGYQSAKGNKLIIFAVDQGILQVANYQAPKPLAFYLKKKALGVSTLQILDLIMPEYSLLKQVSAAGGGAAYEQMAQRKAIGKNLNPFTRQVAKPVAFWSGVITSEGQGEVVFNMPESFAGQLQVMAIAVGASQLADTTEQVLVRGPFAITPNILQHAAPGDSFSASFTVSNLLPVGTGQTDIQVSFSHSPHIQLQSPSTQTLQLNPGDEQAITLKIKTLEKFGNATVTAEVKGQGHTMRRTASFSVRPAAVHSQSLQSGFHDGDSLSLTPALKLYPDYAKQSLSASTSPMLLLDGLNSYLQNFPHTCTEQMLSKAYSQMLLAQNGYSHLHGQAQKQFAQTLAMLQTRQLSQGGFAYWPGQTEAHVFSSLYAASWLQMAADNNYPVPASMLQGAYGYLQGIATKPASTALQQRYRAMAIYQLTQQGRLQSNALLDLRESLKKPENAYDVSWLYIAASYQKMQQQELADKLLQQFLQQPQNQPVSLHPMLDNMAENAQRLYLMVKHFPNSSAAKGSYASELSQSVFANHYQTLSAALAVRALASWRPNAVGQNQVASFTSWHNNQATALALQTPNPWPKAKLPVTSERVDINAEKGFYYQLQQAGFRRQLPSQATSQGLEIDQAFVNDKGQVVTQLTRGNPYMLRLRIRSLNKASVNQVAWVVLLPAGVMLEKPQVQTLRHRFNYLDVREDRVVIYLDVNQAVTEINLPITATSAGQFVVPSAKASAMYQPGFYGETAVASIEVVAP